MVDTLASIAQFNRLRSEVPSLLAQPRLGDDFQRWHREVLDTLEETFGQSSNERAEFERIAFAVNPESLHRSREQFEAALQERFGITLPDDFEIPQDHYYQERLYEAEEFLLAIIVILRRRENNLP
jgi:hypothetical protein